jgi:hypothetical protein
MYSKLALQQYTKITVSAFTQLTTLCTEAKDKSSLSWVMVSAMRKNNVGKG